MKKGQGVLLWVESRQLLKQLGAAREAKAKGRRVQTISGL